MTIRGLFTLAVVVACDSATPRDVPCEGTCVADPTSHCIRDSCRTDSDCPGGLSCGAATIATAACAGHFEATTCHWTTPSIDRLALIHGFNTRTMELQVTPSPDLGVAWTTPPHAAFVACGVFTCNPVFVAREAVTPDTMLWQIANADACMLELETTDTSRSSLRIEGTERESATPACSADRAYDRVIDFVAAGCWAYDSNEIVAASELVPIPAADLAHVAPVIPAGSTCANDDDACYDAVHGFFGACLAGTCEPRCTSPQDCEVAGRQLLGRAPTATCPWECRTVPASLVGVCSPLAP